MITTRQRYRIAVVQLPGVNCEPETLRALARAGLDGTVVRPAERSVAAFDGVIIPGGFSYQDRVRGGAIGGCDPVLEDVSRMAAAGKPVIGICNGAQVLLEAGLVPGLAENDTVEAGLGPNRAAAWRGYRCAWAFVQVVRTGTATTCALVPGTVVPLPYAHAEGCFIAASEETAARWASAERIAWRYCQAGGRPAAGFPDNPNGSMRDVAALANARGNVVAIMPHPERAAVLHHVAPELEGAWGDRRRAARTLAALEDPGPGMAVFESLRRWLETDGSPVPVATAAEEGRRA